MIERSSNSSLAHHLIFNVAIYSFQCTSICCISIVTFRWFKTIDWDEVYCRQLKPPIVPKVWPDRILKGGFPFLKLIFFDVNTFAMPQVRYEGDTKNFDDYPETDWASVKKVSERQLAMFDDFWGCTLMSFGRKTKEVWFVIYSFATSFFWSRIALM